MVESTTTAKIALSVAVIFTAILAFLYLRNPIGAWNRFLQPALRDIQVGDGTKRAISTVFGVVAGTASLFLAILLVRSITRK
jgi:hypothetical protein